MKRVIILMVALVLAGCLMGATAAWRGGYYSSSAADTFTVDFGGKAELVTFYAPDSNYVVVYCNAEGDTIVPAVTDSVAVGTGDLYLTYPAGVPVNEYGVRAHYAFVDKVGETEVFVYWR